MEFVKKQYRRFIETIDAIEDESAEYRQSMRGKFDGRLALTIGLACVFIATLEYFGSSADYKLLETPLSWFTDDAKNILRDTFRKGPRAELYRLCWWSGSTCFFYFVLPALVVKVLYRGKLTEYGLKLKGMLEHWKIYVGLYLLVLPAVVVVAFTESFQRTYPFYDNAYRTLFDLLAWECIYLMQFFSLEFFYRGFWLETLKPRFGYYAIFVSVIPYCMIHFGKPYPETIGAILAGIALGTLAMFTRSIWLGVAIHVSVALTMDVLSLGLQGKLAKMSGLF